jgi:hypothetical protein
MLAATPGIGFPEFKIMGKTVTDLAVAEDWARFAFAASSAHADKTAQHTATAIAAEEDRQSLIASLLEKGGTGREKVPSVTCIGSLRGRI